jgi:hypothetical protein
MFQIMLKKRQILKHNFGLKLIWNLYDCFPVCDALPAGSLPPDDVVSFLKFLYAVISAFKL